MDRIGAVQAIERLRSVDEHVRTLQSLGMPPETILAVLKSLYDWAGIPASLPGVISVDSVATSSSEPWYSCQEIAERIDAYSVSDKPHSQFIGAVIRHLGPLRPDIEFKAILLDVREKTDILHFKYSESVTNKIRDQLEQWRRPNTIRLDGRVYYIRYRSHSNSHQHMKVS
jgi:hypothetical protein